MGAREAAMTHAVLALVLFAEGPGAERLTADGLDKVRPTWAPDGRHLMVSRSLADTTAYHHIVIDTGSPDRPERRLTTRPGTEYHGAISPDGSRVLLTVIPVTSMQGDCDLASVPFAGGEPVVLLGYKEGPHSHQEWPTWSPDGERFAFVSTHEGNQEIYAARADGSEVVRLTQHPGVDSHPSWSPDGTRIAFATDRFGGLEIAAMGPDGSDVTRLTASPGIDDYPAFSPLGRRIAFETRRDGQVEVYLMAADGSGPVNLTRSPGRDTMPTWTTDGRRVTFVSDRDGAIDLYTIEVGAP